MISDFYIYKGYAEHVVSTLNEWLMSLMIILVIATFFPDFKKIQFKQADVKIKNYESMVNLKSQIYKKKHC